MKARIVVLSPEARADLAGIEEYISGEGNSVNAMRFVERIGRFCASLATASERGTRRDDVRPDLRVVGFERSVTVAFTVSENTVHVQRIFYGGVNWQRELRKDGNES